MFSVTTTPTTTTTTTTTTTSTITTTTNFLGCPVSTDDHYEIIENTCFYFKNDFGARDFDSAQIACESKFPYGSGQLFEPKSLSHLQKVRDEMTKRSMNCVYLGIDDSANEGSYIYTSDGSPLVSNIESTIVVTNGCGSKNCDHLYTCSHITVLYTIWETYNWVDLVCTNAIPEGTFCILMFLLYN